MISKSVRNAIDEATEYAKEAGHEYVTQEHLLLALTHTVEVVRILLSLEVSISDVREKTKTFLDGMEKLDHIEHMSDARKVYDEDDINVFSILEMIDNLDDARVPQFTIGMQRILDRAVLQMRASGRETEEVDGVRVLIEILGETDSHACHILERLGVTRIDVIRRLMRDLVERDAHHMYDTDQAGETSHSFVGSMNDDDSEDVLDTYTVDLIAEAKAGAFDPLIGREAELERMVHILARRRKNNLVLVGEAGVGKTALAEGLAQRIVSGEVPPFLKKAHVYTLDLGALLAGTRYRGDFEQRLKAVLATLEDQDVVLFIDEIHTLVGAGATEGGTMDAANLLKPALGRGKLRVLGATTSAEVRHLEKDRALWRRFQTIDVIEPSQEDAVQILHGLVGKYAEHHGVEYSEEAIVAAVQLSARYLRDKQLPDKAIDVLDEAGAAFSSRGVGDGTASAGKGAKKSAKKKKTRKTKAAHISVVDIEATVARMARVPLGTVKAEEVTSLASLEDDLKKRVFGQTSAIHAVANAVKLARAGLRQARKPQGMFLFAGPTGVGKTELARALAGRLGIHLARFDMSEYQEAHTVARLIGAPPGYVGFDQGGLLTEAIAKNPHAVLLLDEIEKAHPDVYNIFLQLMDYGTLADHSGKEIDGRGLIIIFTTNAGAAEASRSPLGFTRETRSGEAVEAIKRKFSPEFRNRLDAVLHFESLSKEVMSDIVDKFISELQAQLTERQVELHLTSAARLCLAELGYDPVMGARPLERVIEEKIKRPLADKLLFGNLKAGGKITVDVGKTNQHDFSFVELEQVK